MALAVNGINMAAEAARQTMTAVRMLNQLWTTTMVLLGAKNPWCSPLVVFPSVLCLSLHRRAVMSR